MYIDLIVLVIIILLVFFFFKRFSSFIYLMSSLDILYRLLHFLADNLKVPELSSLINKYIPENMVGLMSNYVGSDGVIYTILIWFMFFVYAILLFYIIRILIRRK